MSLLLSQLLIRLLSRLLSRLFSQLLRLGLALQLLSHLLLRFLLALHLLFDVSRSRVFITRRRSRFDHFVPLASFSFFFFVFASSFLRLIARRLSCRPPSAEK